MQPTLKYSKYFLPHYTSSKFYCHWKIDLELQKGIAPCTFMQRHLTCRCYPHSSFWFAVKLATWEDVLDQYVQSIRWVPEVSSYSSFLKKTQSKIFGQLLENIMLFQITSVCFCLLACESIWFLQLFFHLVPQKNRYSLIDCFLQTV